MSVADLPGDERKPVVGAHADPLVAHGATLVEERQDQFSSWITMADPEGNEFRPVSDRGASLVWSAFRPDHGRAPSRDTACALTILFPRLRQRGPLRRRVQPADRGERAPRSRGCRLLAPAWKPGRLRRCHQVATIVPAPPHLTTAAVIRAARAPAAATGRRYH